MSGNRGYPPPSKELPKSRAGQTLEEKYQKILAENSQLKKIVANLNARLTAMEKPSKPTGNASSPAGGSSLPPVPEMETETTAGSQNNSSAGIQTSPKVPKPPPIFVTGVTDISKFDSFLATVKLETCERKTTSDGQLILRTKSTDDYRKLANLLQTEVESGAAASQIGRIQFHTYQLKSDKPFTVFVRNLHPSTPVAEISNELSMVGHIARRVTNIRIRKKLNDQVTLCLLYTSPSPRDRTRSRMPSSA